MSNNAKWDPAKAENKTNLRKVIRSWKKKLE